jgi:hypothetical protein
MIVGCVSWVIWGEKGYILRYTKYWPPLLQEEKAKCSLPHRKNEREQSVNDFWSSIFGNMSGVRLQASINMEMAALRGRYVQDIPTTSSGTVITHFMYVVTTQYW